jgi:hypothetical protein
VGSTVAAPSSLGIGEVADLQQLRSRPWRPRNQAKRQPSRRRGLMTAEEKLTDTGRAFREEIEVRTDELE